MPKYGSRMSIASWEPYLPLLHGLSAPAARVGDLERLLHHLLLLVLVRRQLAAERHADHVARPEVGAQHHAAALQVVRRAEDSHAGRLHPEDLCQVGGRDHQLRVG
jgi:hypothetical protein